MANESTLQKYLDGTLKSDRTSRTRDATVKNRLGITVKMARIDESGKLKDAVVIKDGDELRLREAAVGDVYLITMLDGAYVRAWSVDKDDTGTTISPNDLVNPNFIGDPPSFKTGQSAPVESSAPVLVGIGRFGDDKVLTREQFWILNEEETELVPAGVVKESSVTVREGVQNSTTVINTVAAEVGTSASAGWGPISVTVSASLSASTSTEQTVAFSNEKTKMTTVRMDNTGSNKDRMFIVYQLRDRFTFWKNVSRSQPDARDVFFSDNPLGRSVAAS